MRRTIFVVTAVIAGWVAGAAAFLWIPNTAYGVVTSIKNGSWSTSEAVGTAQAGVLTRAIVARTGLFALSKEETIYYRAVEDSDGVPFDGACRYRVIGDAPQARWWSITIYGADNYLIETPENRYSIGSKDVGGTIDFAIAGDAEGLWLPVADGPFSLTMRLYNPVAAVYENLATTPLPAIIREGCR
ncbi:MAG: DUF1214 domain-containing protein [Paracoccaceae bacterium]